MKIEGISAIVTGSGGTIGRAIARELAHRGARVACVDKDEIHLLETADLINQEGGTAIPIAIDLTDRKQVEAMVVRVINTFGQVDVLVNNAAIFHCIGGLWEVDPDEWWLDVTTNVLGPFLCCRTVLPHMIERNQGIIVNLSGGGFGGPVLGGSGYSASKTALIRMTDTLAFELNEKELGKRPEGLQYNIQVYAMEPAFVNSGMNYFVADSPQGQRWLPHVNKNLYAGNVQPAENVGKAVCTLVEVSTPLLSGRVFSYRENIEELARRASEIRERDIFQLRMRFS